MNFYTWLRGNVNLHNHCGKQNGELSKAETTITVWPGSPATVHLSKGNMNSMSKRCSITGFIEKLIVSA